MQRGRLWYSWRRSIRHESHFPFAFVSVIVLVFNVALFFAASTREDNDSTH
jgi:hypothetical protein